MQFDHLMHWVPDLDAAMQDYQGLGFTIQPGGEHPGVGTRNAAWRIDARYIELIMGPQGANGSNPRAP